ncbi:nucleotide exchange factor GrpE [Desulfosarcina ovata]|nr:nucleotide exchange factor GrpE [Desulfosarcina ovata]
MKPSILTHNIRRGWQWCFQTWIAPSLRHTATLFLHWAASANDSSVASGKWKEKAMDDFSSWLAALPDTGPDGEPDPQACDLYTLLTEFAALRQEINLQTRQQRKTLRSQTELAEQFGRLGEQFDVRIAQLDQIRDALCQGIEEKTAAAFFDIRDALVRGEKATRSVAGKRGFWRRAPKGIDTLAEGYAMARRRFDHALDQLGITPIVTTGRPFDATCMRAVDKRHVADSAPGIVIEEIAGGFIRAEKVLRTAEVVVNA